MHSTESNGATRTHTERGSVRQIVPGAIGGKTRGLVHAVEILGLDVIEGPPWRALVRVPDSYVIGTDLFDALLQGGGEVGASDPDGARRERIAHREMPPRCGSALRYLAGVLDCPLAVRSSSLLEDSEHHSFAGLFETVFLANTGTLEARAAALERAVRSVLASAFNPNAASYRAKHGLRAEDEKMAVLVQPVVGARRGRLFFPLVAGVAFSRNFYPWADRIRRDDGVVRLVFGLGTRAVGRNYARVFSLTDPRLRPEGMSIGDILKYSQEVFDAIDLDADALRSVDARSALELPDVGLQRIASLLRNGCLVETSLPIDPGERVVLTFDPLLLSDRFAPFVPLMHALLQALERGLGVGVDVEFALELDPTPRLWLLQVRPMGVRQEHRRVELEAPSPASSVVESRHAIGNGVLRVEDVVLVDPDAYRLERPDRVVREIARLNRELGSRGYLLVGPGRWGSTNPELGVPVSYADISNAAAIVEVAGGRFAPELSYGTHFFADLLVDGTLFLTVLPERGDRFRREVLPAGSRGAPAHMHVPGGLVIRVDGASNRGQVLIRSSSSNGGTP